MEGCIIHTTVERSTTNRCHLQGVGYKISVSEGSTPIYKAVPNHLMTLLKRVMSMAVMEVHLPHHECVSYKSNMNEHTDIDGGKRFAILG